MHEWRKPLQEARALHKKIEKTPPGPEKNALITKHKNLLAQARENLGQNKKEFPPKE